MYTSYLPSALAATGAAAAWLTGKFPKAATASGILFLTAGMVSGIISTIMRYKCGTMTAGDIFALPVMILALTAAVHSVGYLKGHGEERSGSYWCFFNLTAAAMYAVTASTSAIQFLIAWEIMGAASFALVLFDRHNENSGKAAWIYMIACHAGAAMLILLFFFPHTPGWIFALALLGFGLKIGFPLLHVWLPEAHPAAPAPVSALMSGAMIELGFFGIYSYGLSYHGDWQLYGTVLVILGMIAALGGIIFALAQSNLKKLLAYSSIENMGILSCAGGLALLGEVYRMPEMAIAGAGGFLIHLFNHAFFKGGLFLGAGSVYKATGTLDMDEMGGLLKRMPRTGSFFILHALGLCGLPPFAGFAGEFLIYYAAFAGLRSSQPMLMCLSLAVLLTLALTGGLAAAAFAKVIGAVFCGEPRSKSAGDAREVPLSMNLVILILFALSCGVLCLTPFILQLLTDNETPALLHLSGMTASVGMISFAVTLLTGIFILIRVFGCRKDERTSLTWDCGYSRPSPAMEYTATSFAATMVDFFRLILRTRKEVTPPEGIFPEKARYSENTGDAGNGLWSVLFKFCSRAADKVHQLQSGSLHFYLLAAVLTLLGMLIFAVAGGK